LEGALTPVGNYAGFGGYWDWQAYRNLDARSVRRGCQIRARGVTWDLSHRSSTR